MPDRTLTSWVSVALGAQLDVPVTVIEGPEPADASHGPSAYQFRVDADALDAPWRGPLLLRVEHSSDGDAAAVERRALELCVDLEVSAPTLLSVVASDGVDRPTMHVTTMPRGPSFVEMLQTSDRADHQIREMAVYQLRMHEKELSAEQTAHLGPLDVEAELEGLAGADLEPVVDWLWRSQARGELGGSPVLCHGGLQPFTLSLQNDGPESAAGEPRLMACNWTGAVAAPAIYDVTASMVSFWAAPYFAESRADRLVMKVVRDLLSREYLARYEQDRPVDRARLDAWTVFHTALLSARSAGTYRGPRRRVVEVPEDLVTASAKHARRLARQFRR